MRRIALIAAVGLLLLGLVVFGESQGASQRAWTVRNSPAPTSIPLTSQDILSGSRWSHVQSDPIPRSRWLHAVK